MEVKQIPKLNFFKIPIEKYEEDMNTKLAKDKKKEILDLFINCNNHISEDNFRDIENSLHKACRRGDLELIKIYLSEYFINRSKTLEFKIDRSTKTASLFGVISCDSKEFIVPRIFQHESVDYLITSVNNIFPQELKTIKFEENSGVKTIYRTDDEGVWDGLFSSHSAEEFYFPASLKELKEGWCRCDDNLTKFIISPMNDRFLFKEDKYLLGKSDPSNDEFDTLLFACRDIEEISIPSNIKIISSYAFSKCQNLTKVEISPNSNLQIIESYAFSESNIKEIFIPSKVFKICENAFYKCHNLTKVEILPDSNLQIIESKAFSCTNIEELYLPTSLKELEEKWCRKSNKLTRVIFSPMNDRFIYKENKILLGKSDPNKDEFDTLLFACRGIKEILIPSNIKIIPSFIFHMFKNLTKVEISPDSNLQIIERDAFSNSNIKEIFIPSKVSKICKFAFYQCSNLTKVKISPDSNLQIIEFGAFSNSNIKEIFIPSKVSKICDHAFNKCNNLTKVEISPNSNLQIIERGAFSESNIKDIFIPSKVSKICENAFYKCENLTKVEISPNSNLQIIERGAFSISNIKDIFIPSKVSKMLATVFYFCKKLQIIEISEKSELESLPLSDFYGCNEVIIMIPSSQKIFLTIF